VADRRGVGLAEREVGVEKIQITMRNCIMAGDGEEKVSAGGGASCELPATFMKRSSSSMLMKYLIRQQSRSQVQVLCYGIISANLSLSCLFKK